LSARLFALADRAIGAVIAVAQWLVLPVSLLLFLQWPLRDLLHAWSREANDLAQWLFALYVSVALTYATRERAHLAAGAVAERYTPALRDRLARAGTALCLLPWSLFVLVAAAPTVWRSIRGLERFPDTYNPGYFIIKVSVCLLALLMLAQAVIDLLRPPPR
jgi:TRAP-type mannitol/chloroaromatic compound transport system permease small subunit